MRLRRRVLVILTLIFLFSVIGGATARELIDGDNCIIDADRIVEGDLFAVCGELIVDGYVQGNILGIARSIHINGQVDGSLYLVGVELNVNGQIGKDVHFAGLVLKLGSGSEFAEQSGLISANLSNTIESDTSLPGSVINVGYQLIVDGHVGREVSFWGSALRIDGEVEGNVYATVGDADSDGVSSQIETLLLPFSIDVELNDPGLVITSNARVDGQLEYTGPVPGVLDGEFGEAVIFHNTSLTPIDFTDTEQTARGIQNYIFSVLNDFITLFVIGGVGLILLPRMMQAPLRPMQLHPISTIGVGLISFIISFPIVFIVFLTSVIIVLLLGILLRLNEIAFIGAIVLGLANFGSAGLFYFTAIYISRIIVGLAVGRLIFRLLRRDDTKTRTLIASLAIGLLLVTISGTIPVVGWIFSALALFLGLGAILSVIRIQFRRFRDAGTNVPSATIASPLPPLPYPSNQFPVLPYFPEDAKRFAPPIIDQTDHPLGADNLPPGFDWWGDE